MWICRSAAAGVVCTHRTWRRDLMGASLCRQVPVTVLSARLAGVCRPAPRMDWRDDMPTMTYPTTAGEQTSIEVTGGAAGVRGHRGWLRRIAGLAGHAWAAGAGRG